MAQDVTTLLACVELVDHNENIIEGRVAWDDESSSMWTSQQIPCEQAKNVGSFYEGFANTILMDI